MFLFGRSSCKYWNKARRKKKGKNVLDVSYNKKSIKNGILEQIHKKKFKKNTIYGDGVAGKFIADILSKIELISEKENYILKMNILGVITARGGSKGLKEKKC